MKVQFRSSSPSEQSLIPSQYDFVGRQAPSQKTEFLHLSAQWYSSSPKRQSLLPSHSLSTLLLSHLKIEWKCYRRILNQDGRVVKALDLSSNGGIPAWVRTSLLVNFFYLNIFKGFLEMHSKFAQWNWSGVQVHCDSSDPSSQLICPSQNWVRGIHSRDVSHLK